MKDLKNYISNVMEAYVTAFILILLFLIAEAVGVDISLWVLYIAVGFTGLSKGLKN